MMHMQFDKNTVQCLRCVLHEVKDHEETQELRLEDGMPDIGEILGCWGQAFLRGKEWRPGGISVNGGINAWVLYKSEDEGEICSVETCIPYQFKCEFSENEIDGGISIQPFLRSMDARMISSRKIMLRGDMSVLCEAMVDSQIHCSTPPSVPEDVMVLEETFEPLLPKEMNEKAFMVDDAVAFPHSVDRINKIIYYQLCPYVTDYKLMTDKIIFRGQSRLHALYMDTEGQLHTWDEEFPFSQFAELGREYADGAIARIVMATTSTTLEKDDGNFRLRAGITGQFLIFDHDKITIVKDAYSPNRTVNVTTEELLIPGVLDVQQPSVTAECKLSNDVNDVVDSILCPAHPKAYKDGEKVSIEYSGVFRTLCRGLDGEPSSQCVPFSKEVTDFSDTTARSIAIVSDWTIPLVMTSGGSLVLKSDMDCNCIWIANRPVNMVTELDFDDYMPSTDDRPSLILRKAGDDTLWEVAKKYGSSVAKILDVNNLQGEPDADRMLIIPIQ